MMPTNTILTKATTISFWHRLLDLISPRACVICGRRLSISEEVICGTCDLHLPRTGYASNPYDNEMAKRFYGRIPIERAAALFFYEGGSEVSRIIFQLKYHGHPEIGVEMGRRTAAEWTESDFFDGIDAIVPVPLARKRERERGYNQSMEIARGVAEVTGLPVWSRVVRRKKFSGSQTHLGQLGRLENVAEAFELIDGDMLRGKHILIIDDIVTTGATIHACVNAMKSVEGLRVSVLSLGVTKG